MHPAATKTSPGKLIDPWAAHGPISWTLTPLLESWAANIPGWMVDPKEKLSPEKRLMLRMLFQAADDILDPKGKGWRRDFESAVQWVRGCEAAISFEDCCIALRLDATAVRERLIGRKA